jgi:fatty-acyl-CoA synthase
MPPGEGIVVELVEEPALSGADAQRDRPQRYRAIVNCGRPVQDMEVAIATRTAPAARSRDRKVYARGPSIMVGYFRDEPATGRLPRRRRMADTGDMGYMSDATSTSSAAPRT